MQTYEYEIMVTRYKPYEHPRLYPLSSHSRLEEAFDNLPEDYEEGDCEYYHHVKVRRV
jgi:hypothetical protein